jgi:hypothetical protein|eukprot:TRINITY_DN54004_c0_g1_i1.p1 TRINITY_DN54004_c0_g1~~TRINITY_DN54004_c0_g1_i1.p1  ORF type:complete len:168 (+),score=8.10 TRINITY_DN54004_c0_g1_i1:324-827(+)
MFGNFKGLGVCAFAIASLLFKPALSKDLPPLYAAALGKVTLGQSERVAKDRLKDSGYVFDGKLQDGLTRYSALTTERISWLKLRIKSGKVVGMGGIWDQTRVGGAVLRRGQTVREVKTELKRAHIEFAQESDEISVPRASTTFHFGPLDSALDGLDYVTVGVPDRNR